MWVFIGCKGKAGSNYNIRNMFKIGRGTANLYCKHVLDAVMYLSAKFIKWPDASERGETGQRLGEKHFPLCVGIVDGTILELMVKPRRHDACDFWCQKKCHALSTLIICDDQKKYYIITEGGLVLSTTIAFTNIATYLQSHAHILLLANIYLVTVISRFLITWLHLSKHL
jgi:hypothetical protein